MNFNECGECTACCNGMLAGESYNHIFGKTNKCHFLNGTCSIYTIRPYVCRKYFCAWKQGLFPDFMRPDKCGTLISVELNNNKQFLKIVTTGNTSPEIINEIEIFACQNKCEVVYVKL